MASSRLALRLEALMMPQAANWVVHFQSFGDRKRGTGNRTLPKLSVRIRFRELWTAIAERQMRVS